MEHRESKEVEPEVLVSYADPLDSDGSLEDMVLRITQALLSCHIQDWRLLPAASSQRCQLTSYIKTKLRTDQAKESKTKLGTDQAKESCSHISEDPLQWPQDR